METWKPVLGYEDHYSVSNLGRVMRTKQYKSPRLDRPAVQNKILKPAAMNSGYLFIVLCKDGTPSTPLSLHRLVAAAFIGPCPKGKEVNHKNGVRTDNRVENLEYMTRRENIIHGHKNLPRKPTSLRGHMLPHAKLDEHKVRDIRRRINKGEPLVRIAEDYNIVRQAIWHIAHNKTWKWVI